MLPDFWAIKAKVTAHHIARMLPRRRAVVGNRRHQVLDEVDFIHVWRGPEVDFWPTSFPGLPLSFASSASFALAQ